MSEEQQRAVAAAEQILGSTLQDVKSLSAFRQEMGMLLFVRMFANQAWLLERALGEDVTWGISTNRPRLLWHLEAAIAGAEQVPFLAGLRATAMRWHDDRRRRWPDAQPLALYPAFR